MFDHGRYQRVAPSPFNPPPPTIRPMAAPSVWGRLYLGVVRPLWAWRVELALLAVLVITWRVLSVWLGARPAVLVLAAVVGVMIMVPAVRAGLGWWLHAASVCRAFARGCRHAGLATANDRVPAVRRVARVACGERLHVRLPAGSAPEALADAAGRLAVSMDVAEVRVARARDRAAQQTVTVVRRDPFLGPPIGWPWAGAGRLSAWAPVPVGVDEDGGWVSLSLPEQNVLVGGIPGAGKSAALSLLVATAACDPSADLVLLDGKLVELACWAGVGRTVGPDIAQAVGVLGEVRQELDARLALLLANRRRKLTPELDAGLLVVVIDELALYVAHPDKRAAAEFTMLLRDLVARGRAAGVVVLAATQKPQADVIPSSLRDLFSVRWAMRCGTPQASDTVLGAGWASLGHNAQTINPATPGVGLLLHETGVPVRLRACYLDDGALLALAAQAEHARSAARPAGTAELGGR